MTEELSDLHLDNENNTAQDMKEDSEQEIGSGAGNPKECSSIDIILDNFTINVFFDGTGNNAHNTEFRLLDEEYLDLYQKYQKKTNRGLNTGFNDPLSLEDLQKILDRIENSGEKLDQDIQDLKEEMDRYLEEKEYANRTYLNHNVSYRNEFSNVALLHLASDKKQKKGENIYIEGAGTTKDLLDDQDGLGFAKGASGVFSRVNEAFITIDKEIRKNKYDRYTINVFGFSRGSFYARVFCAFLKGYMDDAGNTINSLPNPESEEDLQISSNKLNRRYTHLKRSADDFTINLVGIFDTVSSHGLAHYNDPKKFPVDITPDKQDIVNLVHFTAQNEYRQHFPLTPISSALNEDSKYGKSIEMSFPGAHSNIGGAYNDIWIERNLYISLIDKETASFQRPHDGEIDWNWWINKGYYEKNDLIKSYDGFHMTPGELEFNYYNREVYFANRAVRNHYQYIMLTAMKFVSEKYAKINFDTEVDRYQERLKIFEEAKGGQDIEKLFTDNKGDVDEKFFLEKLKRAKILDKDRSSILKDIDNKIQSFVKDNIDKKGNIVFDLEKEIPNKKDRMLLYNTFICNSLDPIYLFPEWGGDKQLINSPTYQTDKYNIQPTKQTIDKLSFIPGLPGVENEGSTAKNHNNEGEVIRPTVEGG